MISTALKLALLVAMTALLATCSESVTTDPGTQGSSTSGQGRAPRPETSAEQSHRLIPKIVKGGSRSALLAPLLPVEDKLGFGIEIVLRRPGESRRPSLTELTKIQALGRSLPDLLARNLSRYLRDPPPDLYVVQGVGTTSTRIYRLIIDFPGRESLVLLPQLWSRFEEQDGHAVCMALPMRTRLLILPRDNPAFLREMAPNLHKLYTEAADPICAHYIFLEKGRLIAGPSFAALLEK